jgi:hypothetical protein
MTTYEYKEFSFPFNTRPGKDKEVDFFNKVGNLGWKVCSHYLNGVAGGSDKTIYITAFREIKDDPIEKGTQEIFDDLYKMYKESRKEPR